MASEVAVGFAVHDEDVVEATGGLQKPVQSPAPSTHFVVAWQVTPALQGALSPTVHVVLGSVVVAGVQWPIHGLELVQRSICEHVLLVPQGPSTPLVHDGVDVGTPEQKPVHGTSVGQFVEAWHVAPEQGAFVPTVHVVVVARPGTHWPAHGTLLVHATVEEQE